MAEKEKPKVRKIRQEKPAKADASKDKKKTSMRESAAKKRETAGKTKRVRRVAGAAKKPVSAVRRAVTTEFHFFPREDEGNFFTKSRKLTPGYFRSAWAELKQVTWPGRKETWRLVFAVFIFAIVMGTAIAVLDFGLEKLFREVIL